MTVETPERNVVAIQMLRAIAATMVVFVHVDTELHRLHFDTLGSSWLLTGVDIFFVISGFIMWTSVERRPGLTGKAFFRSRLVRIVPLYWAVTAFTVAVGLLAPHLLRSTVIRPGHTIASFLFLPARHPISGDFLPVVIPGWSLNYEMLFYCVFAIGITLSGQSRLRRFCLIAGTMIGILLVAKMLRSSVDVMNFYANPIVLEFVIGIILGIVWTRTSVRRSYYFLLLLAAGFVLLPLTGRLDQYIPTTFVAAMMIVSGAVFLPPIPDNLLSKLGDASYSLYLTHPISLAAVTLAWEHLPVRLDWWLFVLCGVSAAILGAILVYNFFEVPVTRALKPRQRRGSGPSSQPQETFANGQAAPAARASR